MEWQGRHCHPAGKRRAYRRRFYYAHAWRSRDHGFERSSFQCRFFWVGGLLGYHHRRQQRQRSLEHGHNHPGFRFSWCPIFWFSWCDICYYHFERHAVTHYRGFLGLNFRICVILCIALNMSYEEPKFPKSLRNTANPHWHRPMLQQAKIPSTHHSVTKAVELSETSGLAAANSASERNASRSALESRLFG